MSRFFSVMTVGDFKKEQAIVNKVLQAHNQRINDLMTIQDNTISVVESHSQDIARLGNLTNSNAIRLNSIINAMNNYSRTLANYAKESFIGRTVMAKFVELTVQTFTLSSLQNELLLTYLNHANSFLLGLEKLLSHKLHINFINPEKFLGQIAEIDTNLRNRNSKYRVANIGFELTYYLDNPIISFFRYQNSFYLLVEVPLTSHQYGTYELYSIKSYSIPLTSPQHASNDSQHVWTSQLSIDHHYLAYSSSSETYFMLTQNQYNDACFGHNLLMCDTVNNIKPTSNLNCAIAIFLQAKHAINQVCDPTIELSLIQPTSIIHLHNNNYFVISFKPSTTVVQSCQRKLKSYNLTGISLIEVPCNCQTKIDNVIVTPNFQFCQQVYLPNTSIGLYSFNNEVWHQVVTNTLSNISDSLYPNSPLPGLISLPAEDNRQFHPINIKYSLKDIAHLITKRGNEFVFDSNLPYTSLGNFNALHVSYKKIFITSATTCVIINIIMGLCLLFLCRRHRTLQHLLLASHMAVPADAHSIDVWSLPNTGNYVNSIVLSIISIYVSIHGYKLL